VKLLLHTCCAPCTIYPLRVLREEGLDVMGFYYRYNIHPYQECLKRQAALEQYSADVSFRVIYQEGYELEAFLQKIAFREKNRCLICYHERLTTAAHIAKRGMFDCFSTTLLYSKYQRHEQIKSIGEAVGRDVGIRFYYRDFRDGWREGVSRSKELGMYRQQYCGCVYSEKERYYHPSRQQKPSER